MEEYRRTIIKVTMHIARHIVNAFNATKTHSLNLFNQFKSAIFELKKHEDNKKAHAEIIDEIKLDLNNLEADISDLSVINTGDETQESILEKIGYMPANALFCDGIYGGINLSTKFATEIEASPYNGDAWAWIKARIQAGNFSGIHIGDYISFSLNAGTITDGLSPISIAAQNFEAQIAGINTYKGLNPYGAVKISNHIDFITKTCINTPIQWQINNNNNGTAVNVNPWCSSKVYAVLNGVNNYTTNAYGSIAHGYDASSGGVFQLLPSELQNVIIGKYHFLESRYSSSGILTTSSTWWGGDMGKLWLPTEMELYCTYKLSVQNSDGAVTQYPLFKIQTKSKTNSNGNYVNYQLCTPVSGNSSYVCGVYSYGLCDAMSAANTSVYSPICFRIS